MTEREIVPRTARFAALAAAIGFVAFIPLFGVLFTGPADIARWEAGEVALAAISLVAFFGGGAAIGYFGRSLWPIAAILAWPCVVASLTNLVAATSDPGVRSGVPSALMVLVVPLSVALAGGYVGQRLSAKQPV